MCIMVHLLLLKPHTAGDTRIWHSPDDYTDIVGIWTLDICCYQCTTNTLSRVEVSLMNLQ